MLDWKQRYSLFKGNNMVERKVGLLGKLPAKRPLGLHMLSFYQRHPLPAAPITVEVPKISNWQMLGNDQYGDCTFAGIVHAMMSTANVLGLKEDPPSAQKVIQAYLTYTHGQDLGAVEADLLRYWQQNELFGGKVAAYAPTDRADIEELKSVINSYGLVYIGIEVPSACQQQFQQHKPWALTNTPADYNIIGGHCIILNGYDEKYFYGITWGAVQAIEWSWLQSYMTESWAIITPEIVTAGKYGQLRLEELLADIEKL